MNIRDHIIAGHYPTDDKGRALVPTSVAFVPMAWSAERVVPGPHEVVLILPPIEAEPDRRNQFTLSDAKPDKAKCEKAKERLVVIVKGGKLVCFPVEAFRVF